MLQWKLPETLVRPLLNFDVLLDRKHASPCSDLALVKHGGGLMRSRQPENREIVLLEVHARLLRLAAEMKGAVREAVAGDSAAAPGSGFGLFERILQIVSERYQSPLHIPESARELRVSRTHVMRYFRKMTGMTLLEYITQRRVSCAQRLLTTTDMKMLDIAYASGFNSPARFYACFNQVVEQSPSRYRKSVHAAKDSRRTQAGWPILALTQAQSGYTGYGYATADSRNRLAVIVGSQQHVHADD